VKGTILVMRGHNLMLIRWTALILQRVYWDIAWRSILVRNLALLVPQLWSEGVTEIFVDGSFVEDKLRPGDIRLVAE